MTHAALLSKASWVALQAAAEVLTYQDHLRVARHLVASKIRSDDSALDRSTLFRRNNHTMDNFSLPIRRRMADC